MMVSDAPTKIYQETTLLHGCTLEVLESGSGKMIGHISGADVTEISVADSIANKHEATASTTMLIGQCDEGVTRYFSQGTRSVIVRSHCCNFQGYFQVRVVKEDGACQGSVTMVDFSRSAS